MSGGSMDYLYHRIEDAAMALDTPLRRAFKAHLNRVAAACKAIEWNDSGDGASNEDALILACLPNGSTDVLREAVREAEATLEALRAELARQEVAR